VNQKAKDKKEIHFEEAFSRLEEILEHMNTDAVSIDKSLKLYEEADGLIRNCTERLNDAEQKIEIMIRTRNGECELGEDGKPLHENFSSQQMDKA